MSGSQDRIYLDYAASTPLRPDVLEAMLPWLRSGAHNASSLHAEGRAAKAALDDARERVAASLGARAKEIVFTGGGSEADNLAIFGAARAAGPGRGAVVCSAIEHHAVLHAADALASEGFEHALVRPDEDGRVSPGALSATLDAHRACLVSIMYVNNELGTIAPVAELAGVSHEAGALFHTDAVQAAIALPLDVGALGVDLLSLAGHKIGGPKGSGVLFVRDGTPLRPMVYGGSQESAKRAGTENLAAIVGFAHALEAAVRERAATATHLSGLRSLFEAQLHRRVDRVRVNGEGVPRAPHISNVSFAGALSEALLIRLDLDGLAVSAGSACASGAPEPSHVIAALGLPDEWRLGTVRFSFGRETSQDDVIAAVEKAATAVEGVRASACF